MDVREREKRVAYKKRRFRLLSDVVDGGEVMIE